MSNNIIFKLKTIFNEGYSDVVGFYNFKNKPLSERLKNYLPSIMVFVPVISILTILQLVSVKSILLLITGVTVLSVIYAIRSQAKYRFFRKYVFDQYKVKSEQENFNFNLFIKSCTDELRKKEASDSEKYKLTCDNLIAMLTSLTTNKVNLLQEHLDKDSITPDDFALLYKESKMATKTPSNSKCDNKLNLANQVFIIDYMLRELKVSTIDRTTKSRFITKLLQKELDAKKIANTNTYQFLSDWESSQKEKLSRRDLESAKIAIELFDSIELTSISDKIKKQMDSFND